MALSLSELIIAQLSVRETDARITLILLLEPTSMAAVFLDSVIPNVLPKLTTVCVTGKIPYGSRAEVQQMIGKAGGIVHDEVMSTTRVLVSAKGLAGKSTAKRMKARAHDTPIIDEQMFLRVLQGTIPFQEALANHNLNQKAKTDQPIAIEPAKPRLPSVNADLDALAKYVANSMCAIGF